MTSTRLILIFLGFIFVIIVILSSSKIAGTLRQRFGNIVPLPKVTTEEPTPTLTPTIEEIIPTPTIVYGVTSTPTGEVPATGAGEIAYLLLGGGLLLGFLFKKAAR